MGSSWIATVFALTAVAASVVAAQASPVTRGSSPPPAATATASPAPGQAGSTMPNPSPNSTGQMRGMPMGSPMPAPKSTPQPRDGQTERVAVPLAAMPAGTVTLSIAPRSRLVVAQLNLFGLAPGTQHRIALYRDRDGGEPIATFPDVTVDGTGQLMQTVTSLRAAHGGLPRSLFFQIDLQPTGQPQQPIGVAHRPVPRTGSNHVTLAFVSTIGGPGHSNLVYDPATHRLTVSLQVSGLVPGSHHAAHIHTGSCRVQGS